MQNLTPSPAPFSQARVLLTPWEENKKEGTLKAMAVVRVYDAVYLTGLRIVRNKFGQLVLLMPTRKNANGEPQDVYFCASKMMRDQLQALVFEAYERECAAVGKEA